MNYLGTYTLFKKEVRRFMKVYNQTLLAPVITSLLFLAVFSLSVGRRVQYMGAIPFTEFMASGLIIMSVVQQVFANTSSSLTMAKVLGNLVDLLMPPISAGEIVLAYVGGAMVRGMIVGVISFIAIHIFIDWDITHPIISLPGLLASYHVAHPAVALLYIFCAAIMLALLGLIAGVLSETFEQMTMITSYVITPLSFLSGTFYSTKNLPVFWQHIAHANPFFYMIDGFRYGMTGYTDGNPVMGALLLVVANVVLWLIVWRLIARGYRLKT